MKSTVLVTGASGGLGLELAREFAAHGHDLIITARSEQKLLSIKDSLEATYAVKVTSIVKDLGEADAAAELMAAINAEHLQIDILVNNAGFGDFGPFASCDYAKQQAMVQLNIIAMMQLTHLVLPQMKQRRSGKILNIASIAAFEPGPFMSVYYASKAFVSSFSQALARELKGSGITVTALCPGPIATGFEKAADLQDSKLFESLPVASASHVAKYGYKATVKGKTVAIHGWHCKLMIFGVRLAPRNLVTYVIAKIQGKTQPPTNP